MPPARCTVGYQKRIRLAALKVWINISPRLTGDSALGALVPPATRRTVCPACFISAAPGVLVFEFSAEKGRLRLTARHAPEAAAGVRCAIGHKRGHPPSLFPSGR